MFAVGADAGGHGAGRDEHGLAQAARVLAVCLGLSRMVLSAACYAVLRSPARTVSVSVPGLRTVTVARPSAVTRWVASSMLVLSSMSPEKSQPSQVLSGLSQRR